MSCIGRTINIYYNNLQNKLLKKFIHMKEFFWAKGHAILFKNNHVVTYLHPSKVFKVTKGYLMYLNYYLRATKDYIKAI